MKLKVVVDHYSKIKMIQTKWDEPKVQNGKGCRFNGHR